LHWAWSTRLQAYIAQAGLQMKAAKLVLISLVAGMAAYLLVAHYYPQFAASILVGLVAVGLPFAYVAWRRQKRLRKFEEHFPEALDLLGRAVRAGHAFTTGLEMIAKESAEPIAGEFRT